MKLTIEINLDHPEMSTGSQVAEALHNLADDLAALTVPLEVGDERTVSTSDLWVENGATAIGRWRIVA